MSTSQFNIEAPDFKYSHWAQQFRERIAAGELRPGARLPSQNELYAAHGLSRPTVERVYQTLENEGLVVREHRRGVFVAKQSVRDQVANTVALVCTGFSEYENHPYYLQIISTAHCLAERDGMRIVLCGNRILPDLQRINGLLLIPPYDNKIRDYVRQVAPQTPMSFLLEHRSGFPSVIADELHGVRQATEHLLQLGHRRIAMLSMDIGQPWRHTAYQEALQEAGIAPHEAWLKVMPQQNQPKPFENLGYHYMQEWLGEDWAKLGCTALLCHNDGTAAGVLQALGEAGIRVPDDLSLVGFDGTQIADYLTPRLTTVEMPLAAMMERAWAMLRERWHPLPSERPAPETVMLPTKLRIAHSTAAPKHREESGAIKMRRRRHEIG
jgi:DNA-binding LacI/PurR family transcriptional regulator